MKHFLAICLLAVLPLMAGAANPVTIRNVYYNLNSSTKEAEVTNRLGGAEEGMGSYSGSVSILSSFIYNGVDYTVTSIGDHAFDFSTGLTSVTIPSSVKSLGEYSFYGCDALTSITIPEGVTSIGEYAFGSCLALASVTIPNSMKSIGKYAFGECSSLTSVTIPNSVMSIGEWAFAYCSNMVSVTIPKSVTSIGERAFWYCASLTSVTSLIENPFEIKESVFSVYSSATLIVPYETKGKYEATPAWNKFQSIEEMPPMINGIYYNLDFVEIKAEVTNKFGGISDKKEGCYSGNVVIPNRVTFDGVVYSVTSIGDHAFAYCSGLKAVTIPNSVTSIEYYAFGECTALTSVEIPNSLTNIGDCAFRLCGSLASVTIGNSVKSIGKEAFSYCRSLTSVTIPSSVTSIGEHAFLWCDKLTSATISNSVTSIKKGTFLQCHLLSSVNIPNSVTSIGNRAFAYCKSLTSITIPNSVKSIEDYAFEDCKSLTHVTSLIINPFFIDENVFSDENENFTSATLYVPKGTKSKYKVTVAWNKFQKIEEIEVPGLKGDVNGDGAVDVADIGAIIDVMASGSTNSDADVNGDKTVDVADIGTVIDIMAGKDVDTPEEQAYTTCPDSKHPHWIDLGLPSGTKWACCNVGASKPMEYGEYYTYDEAQAFNPPSLDQIEELFDKTTSEWISLNGVNGRKFKSSNGGYVFLPAAGLAWDGGFMDVGSWGDYWLSAHGEERSCDFIFFSSDGTFGYSDLGGSEGLSVRPVRKN